MHYRSGRKRRRGALARRKRGPSRRLQPSESGANQDPGPDGRGQRSPERRERRRRPLRRLLPLRPAALRLLRAAARRLDGLLEHRLRHAVARVVRRLAAAVPAPPQPGRLLGRRGWRSELVVGGGDVGGGDAHHRRRAHRGRQRRDCARHHAASDEEVALLDEEGVPEVDAQVGQVGLLDVVALGAAEAVVAADPRRLDARLEGGLQHRVARDLGEVARGEAPHLPRDAVLLHERLLGVVEHERVVRRERDVEPAREELLERVLGEAEEERVVGEGREREPDLAQVVQVGERRRLAQVDAVVDAARGEEGDVEVVEVARLARVRPEAKGGEALGAAQLVEGVQVGVHKVAVVRVVRVCGEPVLGQRRGRVVRGEGALWLGLVVDQVEGDRLLQHQVQLRVALRVDGDLEERDEEVLEEGLEVGQHPLRVVHAVQPRHLDDPPVVVRVERVVDDPLGERVPLGPLAAVDGDAVLCVLVL
mmetsp:Transcript_25897/g.84931  ORF Transcript_25897/g.84931 Transcript_25897/m.84931 type:complete len:478 (-) Transcript_25897:1117-2550(-)